MSHSSQTFFSISRGKPFSPLEMAQSYKAKLSLLNSLISFSKSKVYYIELKLLHSKNPECPCPSLCIMFQVLDCNFCTLMTSPIKQNLVLLFRVSSSEHKMHLVLDKNGIFCWKKVKNNITIRIFVFRRKKIDQHLLPIIISPNQCFSTFFLIRGTVIKRFGGTLKVLVAPKGTPVENHCSKLSF